MVVSCKFCLELKYWLIAWSSQHRQCEQSALLLQFVYAAKEETASFGLQLTQQTTMSSDAE